MNQRAVTGAVGPFPPPTIPRARPMPSGVPQAPRLPGTEAIRPATSPTEPDTLADVLMPTLKAWPKNLPRLLPKMLIFLAIIIVINVALMPLQLWRLSPAVANFVQFLVFMTAAYNKIIPKTLFWSLVFFWGKSLLRQSRSEGLDATAAPFSRALLFTRSVLPHRLKTNPGLWLVGVGLGLAFSNYLTTNVLNRSLISLMMALVLFYALGQSDSFFLTVLRLGTQDAKRWFRRPHPEVAPEDLQYFLSGVSIGLILNFIFIFLRLTTAGYIAGIVVVMAGLVLPHVMKARVAA